MRAPTGSESQPPTFSPGDHLEVRRGWLYMHHGIYVSEDRVIQFGGRVSDKPRATIMAVPLAEFAKGGRMRVVREVGPRTDSRLRTAELPERVVQKAEWLLEHHSEWLSRRSWSRYNVFGNNCEHAATFCANYGRAESVQVGVAAVLGLVAARLPDLKIRGHRLPIPKAFVLFGLLGPVGTQTHNWYNRRLWRGIGAEWFAFERTLPSLFRPGEHIIGLSKTNQVHHGIYVNEERVIQFSRNSSASPTTYVKTVTLREFDAGDDAATVVSHWRRAATRKWLTADDSPEQIVQRAEWLLAKQASNEALTLRGGEWAGNWCATGDHRIHDVILSELSAQAGRLMVPKRGQMVREWFLEHASEWEQLARKFDRLRIDRGWREIAEEWEQEGDLSGGSVAELTLGTSGRLLRLSQTTPIARSRRSWDP
jgi:hypothetical protein